MPIYTLLPIRSRVSQLCVLCSIYQISLAFLYTEPFDQRLLSPISSVILVGVVKTPQQLEITDCKKRL